jgi:hypothetical protein
MEAIATIRSKSNMARTSLGEGLGIELEGGHVDALQLPVWWWGMFYKDYTLI